MKRSKAQPKPRKVRKTKKDKFWSGSGKFFLSLIVLYALIIGINEIVSLGQDEMQSFKPEIIEVTGNDILSSEKVKELCEYDFANSKNIDLNIEQIAESLMKSYYIKGVSVTKRLPRTLNITVEERKPIAFIHGRGLNLIDEVGFLMPVPKIKKSWDLPFISGISESLGKLGDKTVSKQALNAVNLVSYLHINDQLMYGLISEINMKNQDQFDLIMIKGGAKIRLSKTDYEKELYVVKNYINRFLNWNDMAHIDYIDLRFKDQLIVKKKT